MMLTEAKRAEKIAACRQALLFFEDHPDWDLPYWVGTACYVSCHDTDVLLAKRRELGACEKVFQDDQVGFDHDFGAGCKVQLRLPRKDVCEVVGTEEVWEEGYSVPGRFVTKNTYSCPDSLISKLGEVG